EFFSVARPVFRFGAVQISQGRSWLSIPFNFSGPVNFEHDTVMPAARLLVIGFGIITRES
ncbi:MAG: hypothetical protein KGQ70_04530, partial [Alphaproteobacteria bacterium]|nr:hypothetical protein [Alphaproteobacteria bacterium]